MLNYKPKLLNNDTLVRFVTNKCYKIFRHGLIQIIYFNKMVDRMPIILMNSVFLLLSALLDAS